MRSSKALDFPLVLLMCTIWGGEYIILKVVLEYFDPIFYSGMRFLLASLCTLPFCKNFSVLTKNFPKIFWMSFLLVIVTYGIADIGIKLNDSLVVSNVILQCSVFMGPIFGSIFLRETLTRHHRVGIFLAICGVLLTAKGNVIGGSDSGMYLNSTNLLSIGLILTSLLGWPMYGVLCKKVCHLITDREIIAFTGLVGGVQALVLSSLFEPRHLENFSAIVTSPALISCAFLYSGILAVVLGNSIYHYLLKRHSLSKLSLTCLLTSLVSGLGAVLFLGNELNKYIITGSCFVVVGLIVASRGMREPRLPPACVKS